MSKPRKKYKPKPVWVNTIDYVVKNSEPAKGTPELVTAQIRLHTAFDALRDGTAQDADLGCIVAAHNVCKGMALEGVGRDGMHIVEDGCAAILAICARKKELGHYVCRGLELLAIGEMIEFHDAQLDAVTRLELHKGLERVKKEVARGNGAVIKINSV